MSQCRSLWSLSYLKFVKPLGCGYSYLSSNWGSFQPLFLQMLFLPLSLFSFCNSKNMCILEYLMKSHKSFKMCSFLLQSFSSFFSSDCLISIVLSSSFRFFLPTTQIWCWIHVVNYFYSTAVLFSSRTSILGPFYDVNVLSIFSVYTLSSQLLLVLLLLFSRSSLKVLLRFFI